MGTQLKSDDKVFNGEVSSEADISTGDISMDPLMGHLISIHKNRQKKWSTKPRKRHNSFPDSNINVDNTNLDSQNPKEKADSKHNHTLKNKTIAYSKNSRKSRNAKGRGLAKKMGGGGKGTWGKPGCELYLEEYDSNTPPETDEDFVEAQTAKMSDKEFEDFFTMAIKEHFDGSDESDFLENAAAQPCSNEQKVRLVYLIISQAMDRGLTQRELASVLLADLSTSRILTKFHFDDGFDLLLKLLSTLRIDVPTAPEMLGKFMARAVADYCSSDDYIDRFELDKIDNPDAKKAITTAKSLLAVRHGIYILDNVWTVADSNRPVKKLIEKIKQILQEYLLSGDVDEAERCLRELEVPHFHHEFVFQGVTLVIEHMMGKSGKLISELLEKLYKIGVISPDEMNKGFRRIYANLPDLVIDIPAAYDVMDVFTGICYGKHIIPPVVFKELPRKARRRFISEGQYDKLHLRNEERSSSTSSSGCDGSGTPLDAVPDTEIVGKSASVD